MLNWELFGFVWWQFLLALVFTVYTLVKTGKYFYYAHNNEKLSLKTGLKEAFFEEQKDFTLYDVLRLPFMIPAIVLGTALLLLKEGAWQLFPALRKILGFKLFSLEKKKEM